MLFHHPPTHLPSNLTKPTLNQSNQTHFTPITITLTPKFSHPPVHDLLNLPNFSHLQQMPGISPMQHRSTPLTLGGMQPGSPLMAGGVLLGLGLPQSPQLPQLILTSGQLVQGIQGAQVLIPTPQGECQNVNMMIS
jgi:hypothetical protein